MVQTVLRVVVYCTYKNKSTSGEWHKSREYDSIAELLQAMQSYLEKNPRTTVQYLTRTVYEEFEGTK